MAPRERAGTSQVAPADAWYLFAEKLHTDQFLVYGFAGSPPSVERAVAEVVERARSCSELRLRVGYRGFGLRIPGLGLPEWIPGDVDTGQIIVDDSGVLDWPGCLQATSQLIERHQLDPQQATWRLHVFVGVHGVPASPGQPSTVIVAQISHALADGIRSSALAGVLFGRSEALPAITPWPVHLPFGRSVAAARARRHLVRDTAAGRVPAPPRPGSG